MPEGDTIHRTAARLRPALEDQSLVAFDAPGLRGDRPRAGSTISSVEAIGKHLLMHFDDGLVLHSHMKMSGSWHLYRSGERWQQARHKMRATIDVGGWQAVCFAAPIVQTFHSSVPSISPVSHLGPDLCGEEPDIETALQRMATVPEPDTSICDVLLDQRMFCGVGNVYKSEVLWAEKLSPFASLAEVSEDLRRRLLARSHRLLRANLNNAVRRTVPGGLAVYDRHRQPCRSCGTLIAMRPLGEQPRSTYWCPQCQGALAPASIQVTP